MSIIKGTNQIVAGFGGTKRPLGEVYFSQSFLATDNPGALPGWTGECYENGKTLFPDLYNFVKAHSELQVTKAQYDNAIATYGECPKYVVDENGGTTTGTITVYGWLASGSTFYTKARNPVAGDSVWPSTDTTQESNYTVISLSNDTLTFSGPTKEWSGTYSTTTTGTGLVTTSGTSLRLPKYANYIKMANSTEGIKNIEAGLPNIEHEIGLRTPDLGSSTTETGTSGTVLNGTGYSTDLRIKTSASLFNSIYGKSSTVTPASTTLYPWVVAYTAAIPASTAQAAQFQQGLSGKADTNLSNVLANIDYVVESQVNADGSWYRKYKSGWLEQGGVTPALEIPLNSTSSVATVTFLKPFSKLYSCHVSPSSWAASVVMDFGSPLSAAASNTIWARSITNTAITVDKGVRAIWYAAGQGA